MDTSSAEWQRLRRRFERRAVTPEHAAEKIIAGMLTRRYLVHTSPDIRALHAVQRYAPPVYALMMDAANKVAHRIARTLP